MSYSVVEVTVPNFRVGSVNVYLTGPRVEYSVLLDNEEVLTLISELQDSTSSCVMSTSADIIRPITCKGKLDPNTIIYRPKFENGRLMRSEMPVRFIPDCYSVHFRGSFNISTIVTVKQYLSRCELISFAVKSMAPTDEPMRYMGDEVFPDWLIPDGVHISNEEINRFMDTY